MGSLGYGMQPSTSKSSLVLGMYEVWKSFQFSSVQVIHLFCCIEFDPSNITSWMS